jgi:hypothetical protein
MRLTSLLLTCAGTVLVALAVNGQTADEKRPLTAREMFFAGTTPKAPVAAPSAQPVIASAKAPERPSRPKVEVAAASKAAQPAQVQVASTPRVSAPANTPSRPPAPEAVPAAHRPPSPAVNPNFRTVSYTQGLLPLGVRYSILQRGEGGQFSEVAPDKIFHSGDRIRLSVEVNDAGYLYIVHRGSSGTWKLMFPTADSPDGSNQVEKGRRYMLPPGSVFTFVGEPGEEKLFLVLSRQPEPDLETLIDSLQGGSKPPAPAPVKPQQQMQLAALRLPDDAMINRMRNLYSRDLITEKINEESNNEGQADKAVYVVNSSLQPDSRVVADIALKHR